jgi:hypothetical protein
MKQRIEVEYKVGFTLEQQKALEMATDLHGVKASTWLRQAAVNRLVQEKFLEHPMVKYATAAQK